MTHKVYYTTCIASGLMTVTSININQNNK